MSGVRDLFFDEFYAELETAMENYVNHEHDQEPPRLADELASALALVEAGIPIAA